MPYINKLTNNVEEELSKSVWIDRCFCGATLTGPCYQRDPGTLRVIMRMETSYIFLEFPLSVSKHMLGKLMGISKDLVSDLPPRVVNRKLFIEMST